MLYGRGGSILFIDLTTQRYRIEATEMYVGFIGGRGINQAMLFDRLAPEVDALDPENLIMLGAGPLVGTLVPGACRLAVDFKNAVTGGVGSANLGGHFAAEMKFAGYDHIVISGKARRPVYLYVTPDKVAFRDASRLWGKTTWQTENEIKRLESDRKIRTLSIGMAGENLIRFACIIGDRGRAAGYGGSGAVFGSKQLKAIAVRGGRPLTVAQPDRLKTELLRFNSEVIEKSRFVKIHRAGGTLNSYLLPRQNRPHAVRNMSLGFWDDDAIGKIDRGTIDKRYLVRRHSCFACPIYCSAIYRLDHMVFEGLQANSWRAFASNIAITDPEKMLRLHALCNLYGLDGDHTSAVLAWAVECFEKNLINTTDTDGITLRWGDGDSMERMLENIVHRVGFGDVLARGLWVAARHVGRGSELFAMLSKKNALMEAGMRSHKAWALGILTSTKGGGHLRGAPAIEAQRIPPQISQELFGIDDIEDPTSYKNKAALVTWYENYKGIIDIMGLCYLPSMWMELGLFIPQDINRFYTLVTGDNCDVTRLMRNGVRLQNIETLFNILHAGFGRDDITPPVKLTEIPVHDGPFKGQRLDLKQWQVMLEDYFSIHGWDAATGWPTVERLAELGLGDAINRMKDFGIILPSTAGAPA